MKRPISELKSLTPVDVVFLLRVCGLVGIPGFCVICGDLMGLGDR